MYQVYYKELHKLIRNTILALYEPEVTWNLRVCDSLDALEHQVHKKNKK